MIVDEHDGVCVDVRLSVCYVAWMCASVCVCACETSVCMSVTVSTCDDVLALNVCGREGNHGRKGVISNRVGREDIHQKASKFPCRD